MNTDFADRGVIAHYYAYWECERFHSELKADMDLERLPSGKFETNELVLELAILSFKYLNRGLLHKWKPASHAVFVCPKLHSAGGMHVLVENCQNMVYNIAGTHYDEWQRGMMNKEEGWRRIIENLANGTWMPYLYLLVILTASGNDGER